MLKMMMRKKTEDLEMPNKKSVRFKQTVTAIAALCMFLVFSPVSVIAGEDAPSSDAVSGTSQPEEINTGRTDAPESTGGGLRIENGMPQPILEYSDLRAADYSNEDSDILRYCVYVETDHDTDNDGMADLVKVLIQVPGNAVLGYYKAAVIYDPSPYSAGTVTENEYGPNAYYLEKEFDYSLLYKECEKRQPAKLVLHQDGHDVLDNYLVGGEPWLEIQNKWLAHYLYGVDNGIEEMANLTVQSNIDGKFRTYDSFGSYENAGVQVSGKGSISEVTSVGLAEYTDEKQQEGQGEIQYEGMEAFYLGLNQRNAAVYEIGLPDREQVTIAGVPEVHLRLSTDTAGSDGYMITAVLIDTDKDGELFEA